MRFFGGISRVNTRLDGVHDLEIGTEPLLLRFGGHRSVFMGIWQEYLRKVILMDCLE